MENNLHPMTMSGIHGNELHPLTQSSHYPFIFNPNDPYLNAQLNYYHHNQRNAILNSDQHNQQDPHLPVSNTVQDPFIKQSHPRKLGPKPDSGISKKSNHRSIEEIRIANSYSTLREYVRMNPHIDSLYGSPKKLNSFFGSSKKLKNELISNALIIDGIVNQSHYQSRFPDNNVLAFAKALKELNQYDKKELEWNEFLESGELDLFENFDAFYLEKDPLSKLVPLPPAPISNNAPSSSIVQSDSETQQVLEQKEKSDESKEPKILNHQKSQDTSQFISQKKFYEIINDENYKKLSEFLNLHPILRGSGNSFYM